VVLRWTLGRLGLVPGIGSRCELDGERSPAAGDPGPDGAGGQVQDVGDLGVVEVTEVPEHDRDPEFLFVPPGEVLAVARDGAAIPYDVPNVELSHDGELCSFDAFLRKYRLVDDPALAELAVIVRGADTARPELAPQAAGLLAVSLGLSHLYRDDHEMLKHGIVIYDALYAWCRHARGETHTWNPAALGAYGAAPA